MREGNASRAPREFDQSADGHEGLGARIYGNMATMKTTIEIPDPLFRKAKAHAAEHGQSLKDFVTDAIQTKLAAADGAAALGEPKWMAGFGKLRRLRKETARIQGVVDQAFGVVEAEDRM